MFAKALVIACSAGMASALKLQAKVELASLAGVNIMALSADELAQLRAGTADDFSNFKNKFDRHNLTEDEDTARHNIWLSNKAQTEQYKKDDSSYRADGTKFDDFTSEEKESFKGTKGMSALAKDKQSPIGGRDFSEEAEAQMLASTEDTWNCIYPGCITTYQYVYDQAVLANPTWGCNRFDNWDGHWLEQKGYTAYYDYYVATGYCSDAYLREWWNANIISWRNYLRDYLECTDDSEQQNEEEQQQRDDNNTVVSNCDSTSSESCLWGDQYVTPIKNQGSCGSCYAFSTTQILESYNAINGNGLIALSEQQIVDCGYGNSNGCNGGWPASVLNTVSASENALWAEEDYEYTGMVGNCVEKSGTRVMTKGSSQRVTSNSVQAMKTALMRGPLAITVDANDKFMGYSGDVMRNCVYGHLNHAVNAVGWTVMEGVEVVKIRNSWGTWWGDAGYIYVAIDDQAASENGGKGPCGILEHLYWADAQMA